MIVPGLVGLVVGVSYSGGGGAEAAVITFEDLAPAQPYGGPGGGFFENGASASDGGTGDFDGSFRTGGANFRNSYSGSFGSWTGFSYSTTTDTVTEGYANQFSAFAGGGASGSATYGVGFGNGASIGLPAGSAAVSLAMTNTTIAALSMARGDFFAKKFGGETGADPDFFTVTIAGYSGGQPTGATEFVLADYRFADPAADYIVDTWETVDLTPLGGAEEIRFSFNSSDVGPFGINTPLFFAVDDIALVAVPEHSVWPAFLLVGWAVFWRRCR